MLNSWSRMGSGSFSRRGGVGSGLVVPDLEKAPDFMRNSDRAEIPSLEPSSSVRARSLEPAVSNLRCLLYLGQSLMMWVLVSKMLTSQGQDVGSGERGRNLNDWRNSPVYE